MSYIDSALQKYNIESKDDSLFKKYKMIFLNILVTPRMMANGTTFLPKMINSICLDEAITSQYS